MDELSAVLESFRSTLQERAWKDDTSPTPRPGSVVAGGSLTTAQAQSHPEARSNEPLPPSPRSSPSERPKLIRECLDSQNQLSVLLAQCFLLQKGYGEKAEDAKARDAGFQWILGDYSIDQVRKLTPLDFQRLTYALSPSGPR